MSDKTTNKKTDKKTNKKTDKATTKKAVKKKTVKKKTRAEKREMPPAGSMPVVRGQRMPSKKEAERLKNQIIRYDPEYHPGMFYDLYRRGHTDAEIAAKTGISIGTLYEWLKRHSECQEAKKQAKRYLDDTVEAALYKKAVGYDYKGKHYPGDNTCMIFWLKNRRPREWRDRKEIQVDAEIKAVSELRKTPDDRLLELLEKADIDLADEQKKEDGNQ